MLLWLAWTAFGGAFLWLLWFRYLPAVRQAPPPPREPEPAVPAWLYCEDGAALDRRVRWFELRPGGRTVVGARPRAATPEASFIYLTAEDIRENHVRVEFDPATG